MGKTVCPTGLGGTEKKPLSCTVAKCKQDDVILLDFEKAFDKVTHGRRLYKLGYYGVRTSNNRWIRSSLGGRKQTALLEGLQSKMDNFKFRFFPRTIPAWNSSPSTIPEAPDLVHFKQGLSTLTFLLSVRGRGNPQVRSEGFWSCVSWATISSGRYCSRIFS